MYKNVLQAIENIEIWPIISLIIFFLFFLGVLIYIVRVDKAFIQRMKEMPLDDGAKPETETGKINIQTDADHV
jgi:cytochrome c oxidase cbb3-type subunit IV